MKWKLEEYRDLRNFHAGIFRLLWLIYGFGVSGFWGLGFISVLVFGV